MKLHAQPFHPGELLSIAALFCAGAFLPLSFPYYTLPTLLVLAVATFCFFRYSSFSPVFRVAIFLVSISVLPYFLIKNDWRNGVKDRDLYVLPNDYEGVIGVLFDHEDGETKRYFTTNRRFDIPNNGILLSKFKKKERPWMRYSGSTKFIFSRNLYGSKSLILYDTALPSGKRLSEVITDTTVHFARRLASQDVALNTGKTYRGIFYQIKQYGDPDLEWRLVKEEVLGRINK